MIKVNKFIIIALMIVIIISLIVVNLLLLSSPTKIIANKLKFKLPYSSRIIHFEHNRLSGYFAAKILIDEQSLEVIRKDLRRYFNEELNIKCEDDIPNFENNFTWWDLDKSKILACYNTIISGEKKFIWASPKSRDVWAFITDENDGQHYLYISY